MEVEFSKHALEQLLIRSPISKQMVLETLQKSDKINKSYRKREVYIK